MHIDLRNLTRLGELSAAVLAGVLLSSSSTDSLRSLSHSAPPAVVVDSFVIDTTADELVTAGELVTALDSMEAERELPAAALRRPLEAYLGRYNGDRVLVRRISRAVLREAGRQQVPPSLITAVLLTENTTLRPEAASSVGAQGLMQVMPFHAGARLCNSSDLVDVDSNICHGTLILARNLRATSSSAAALLRYNGCVRGTNTPNCHRYPTLVLTRASVVRRALLASAMPVQLAQR